MIQPEAAGMDPGASTSGAEDEESSQRGEDGNLCFYAKSVLKSSVVTHVVTGKLRDERIEDVVFVKENTLELLSVSTDGELTSICETSLFGVVNDCKLLPYHDDFPYLRQAHPSLRNKDLLVFVSNSGKLSFVGVKDNRFELISEHQISIPGFDRRQLGAFLAIEPHGRAVLVSARQDMMSCFVRSQSSLDLLERMDSAQFSSGINHKFSYICKSVRKQVGRI